MNFIEVMSSNGWAIRRKDKASHVGSGGNGWVDKFYFLSCCAGNAGCYGIPCGKPHLSVEDVLANDWESKPLNRQKKYYGK